jgi:succinate dehydrogenase/fumarate reductase flavoprotein subunit
MGGNALTETIVFGARAGQAASNWVLKNTDEVKKERFKDFEIPIANLNTSNVKADTGQMLANLQKVLWEKGGILRNKPGLTQAIKQIKAIRDEADSLPLTGNPRQVQCLLEIQFATRTAMLILQGALRREESRGAHFREDFVQQDDKNWCGHLQVRRFPDDELNWSFEPI